MISSLFISKCFCGEHKIYLQRITSYVDVVQQPQENGTTRINKIFVVQLLFVGLLRNVIFEALSWMHTRFSQARFTIVNSCFPLLACGTNYADFIASTSGICDKMWYSAEPFVIIRQTWPASLFALLFLVIPASCRMRFFLYAKFLSPCSPVTFLYRMNEFTTHTSVAKKIFLRHLSVLRVKE